MSVLDRTPGLLEALHGEMTPKFLATRSPGGIPNVVPCISIMPADDRPDIVFFGNFLLRKSVQNLQADARVGLLVITPDLRGWMLQGDFVEFQRTGPCVERQMSSSLLRYNAYTGVRNAGIIRVTSVEASVTIAQWQVARDFALARLAGLRTHTENGVAIPLAVQREFARMAAVKVLAWIGGDGYPTVIPALALQPAGERSLVCWQGIDHLPSPASGVPVAANVLTPEAISYQAKGRWLAHGKQGLLEVQEIYAGGPPCPGGRVA